MVAFCSRPLPPISRSISFSQILWKYRIHPRALPNNQGFLELKYPGTAQRLTKHAHIASRSGAVRRFEVCRSGARFPLRDRKGGAAFFIRAEMGKHAGRNTLQGGRGLQASCCFAALAAPYRHAKLSAIKLAGDPNNPARFKDDASADELREEVMRRLGVLHEAGVIDLRALPVPKGGIANEPISGDQLGVNGE